MKPLIISNAETFSASKHETGIKLNNEVSSDVDESEELDQSVFKVVLLGST